VIVELAARNEAAYTNDLAGLTEKVASCEQRQHPARAGSP
jgi:hypothetical protein